MKKRLYILFILFLFPLQIFAYSNKIIPGGESLGIEIYSDGIYIVGFYPINDKYPAKEAGFQIGDIIKEINGKKITSINSLNSIINEDNNYIFKIKRNDKEYEINLPIKEENNIYKTGLYVKNQINGIGTLSYIDPETKIFGALGHEIIETASLSKFELKEGSIYKAEVSSIKKSENYQTGEKNANINKNDKIGIIELNETSGIYGKYQEEIPNIDTIEIGKKEEIKKKEAIIRTVIKDNKVEEFKINILRIEDNLENKNIFFEINDDKLLKETGGIVQGMSGSPIIQDNKLIGVVNYVVIDDVKTGYGIFIETMLEQGDKLLS